MNDAFIQRLFQNHENCTECPSQQEVNGFFQSLMGTLFPGFTDHTFHSLSGFRVHVLSLKEELSRILSTRTDGNDEKMMHEQKVNAFFDAVPSTYELLLQDAEAIYLGDPAATGKDEVIRSYPGFYAIAAYRFAHILCDLGVTLIPRMITEHAHTLTGIDIHPAAEIGHHFCIDHGTGIVIGETTTIGNHVKIYQGVTLGALSVRKEDARTKRHPTIGDHVVIYAGATILGGKTEIGEHSVIGGNVWITQSIPPHTTVHYRSTPEQQTDTKAEATSQVRSLQELREYYNSDGGSVISLTPEQTKGKTDQQILEMLNEKMNKQASKDNKLT